MESTSPHFVVMRGHVPGIFGQIRFMSLKILGIRKRVRGHDAGSEVPALEPSGWKPMAGSPPRRVEVRVEILNITEMAGRVRARLVFAVLSVGVMVFALSPATAGAQQVTDAQYNSTLQLLQSGGGGGGGGDQPSSAPSSGDLPFTGLDVAALLAVGAALAVAGFLLWRRSRTPAGEVGA